jgi:hypothetical protein
MEEEDKLYMNGQEVKLKNPGTDGLNDYLTVAQVLGKMPEGQSNFLEYFDDRAKESLKKLIKLTVKKTFKEVTDEVDEWAMENFMSITNKVMLMCAPKTQTDDQSRIEKLKEKLNKDVKSDT